MLQSKHLDTFLGRKFSKLLIFKNKDNTIKITRKFHFDSFKRRYFLESGFYRTRWLMERQEIFKDYIKIKKIKNINDALLNRYNNKKTNDFFKCCIKGKFVFKGSFYAFNTTKIPRSLKNHKYSNKDFEITYMLIK